jgi:hypothetical protein
MRHLLIGVTAAATIAVIGPASAPTSGAQQRPPIVEKLTKTYGLDSFGQIEAIRYTFNVEAPGLNVSRSWTWETLPSLGYTHAIRA